MLVGVAGRRPVQNFGSPPSSGRRVSHTPGSTFVQLNATGHCPNLSAPEETIDAIKAWL